MKKLLPRDIFVFGVILFAVIFWKLLGDTANSLAFSPEKQTEQFLTAVRKKDFKTIFNIAYYYQAQLSEIRSNNPKVLSDKLTAEFYEKKKRAFFGEEDREERRAHQFDNIPKSFSGEPLEPTEYLQRLTGFIDSCQWKILESKREQGHGMNREINTFHVYVSFTYKDIANSPLVGLKLLKETIYTFVFEASRGLYMGHYKLEKGDIYWDKVPLKILGIRWYISTYPGSLQVTVTPIGGSPPYKSMTNCGKWTLEKQDRAHISAGAYGSVITGVSYPPKGPFPMECITNVTDRSGQTDTVTFAVPTISKKGEDFCWVADPWRQWKQGINQFCSPLWDTSNTPLFELRKAKQPIDLADKSESQLKEERQRISSEDVQGANQEDFKKDERISAIAEKLVRNLSKRPLQVWVGDIGTCLGGSNPDGTIIISAKYASIPDDEMAILLGHEIAHLLLEHDRVAVKVAFPQPILGKYFFIKFVRENEFAADEWGMKLLIRAGYNVDRSLNLYRKEAGKENALIKAGSKIQEDPSFTDRLASLSQFLNKLRSSTSTKTQKGNEPSPISDILKKIIK